jgi:nucleotide-binding universal stress UspA family protein
MMIRVRIMAGIKNILVGVDGSKCSNKAVRYAAELSKKFDATVTLMHVYRPPETTRELPAHERPEEARVKLDDSKKVLDELGVGCKTVFAIGHPASIIIKESTKGYDLIVMGSRGMGFVEGFLLGSTTTRVAHHAKIPVLIVHC